MRGLVAEWYALLSVLLIGLIGTTAPCQLTANASALAYVARRTGGRHAVASNTLAYLLGKVLVYTALGMAIILAGRQLAQSWIPVVVVAGSALAAGSLLVAARQFVSYALGMDSVLTAVILGAAFFHGAVPRWVRGIIPYVHRRRRHSSSESVCSSRVTGGRRRDGCANAERASGIDHNDGCELRIKDVGLETR